MSKYILIVLLMVGNSAFAGEIASGSHQMSKCFQKAASNAYKKAEQAQQALRIKLQNIQKTLKNNAPVNYPRPQS